MKQLMIVFLSCLITLADLYADSSYDREVIILEQSRDNKVREVFSELIAAYEDEDAMTFLDFVAEDRFMQDYMTFTQALDNDFRTYDIHDIEFWIDRIDSDGIKRYLFVRWEKRYETLTDTIELTQRGTSRFLFDEVDGEYKLVEIAGNNLWGRSFSEWRDEVIVLADQEPEENGEPSPSPSPAPAPSGADLLVTLHTWDSGAACVSVKNNGDLTATNFTITIENTTAPNMMSEKHIDLAAGSTKTVEFIGIGDIGHSYRITADIEDTVTESDEGNNVYNGNLDMAMGCATN
jgi:hypothetical protein